MNRTLSQKFILERDLKQVIKQNELILYYQPQIDTTIHKIIGAEALIRWNHASLGIVSPNDFIPLAEETGLIIPIGEWALKTPCSQMKFWLDKGYSLVAEDIETQGHVRLILILSR